MASIRIEVYVQPRASRSEVAGTHDGLTKIRIAASPVDNAANHALIKFMAERLGVGTRSVRIVAGATSRRKVLEIDGVTAASVAALHSLKA